MKHLFLDPSPPTPLPFSADPKNSPVDTSDFPLSYALDIPPPILCFKFPVQNL